MRKGPHFWLIEIMQGEFDRFKTDINLTEYAASVGYAIDRKASSRNSVVMRKGEKGGDKVVIARGYTGQWIYFSVRDDSDNGTIIDFVQKRTGESFGLLRQRLRPWIGEGSRPSVAPAAYVPALEPLTRDRQAVLAAFHRMSEEAAHPYLAGERCIPAYVLSGRRFAGTIYRDGYGNAVFPHRDRDGISGFEIKNHGFTGFAKGGEKGLWFSNTTPADRALVIAETAIDALSFAALFPDESTRYASIAGKMNDSQPALVAGAITKLPAGGVVIASMDNDADGHELALRIRAIFTDLQRGDLSFENQPPERSGADWNDVLKDTSVASAPFPAPPEAA